MANCSTSLQNYPSSGELTHSTVEIPKYDKVPPSFPETANDATKPDHTLVAEQKMLNDGEKYIHREPKINQKLMARGKLLWICFNNIIRLTTHTIL